MNHESIGRFARQSGGPSAAQVPSKRDALLIFSLFIFYFLSVLIVEQCYKININIAKIRSCDN